MENDALALDTLVEEYCRHPGAYSSMKLSLTLPSRGGGTVFFFVHSTPPSLRLDRGLIIARFQHVQVTPYERLVSIDRVNHLILET